MSKITILFDENIPYYLAESIAIIEQFRGNIQVLSTVKIDQLGRGATDMEIVKYAIALGYDCYIITNDKDFSKRQLLPIIMSSSNVGLFLLKFPKGSTFWRKYKFIVNHWEGIVELITTKKNPISYQVMFKSKFNKL